MIARMPATNNPEFCALVMNALLFKLGGQYTLSLVEIAKLSQEYPSVRIALNVQEEEVTLTLLSDNPENDAPYVEAIE
jgi:hypothetical protein